MRQERREILNIEICFKTHIGFNRLGMTHESNPYFVDCLQVNKRDPLRQVFVEVHKNFIFCSANLITEAFSFRVRAQGRIRKRLFNSSLQALHCHVTIPMISFHELSSQPKINIKSEGSANINGLKLKNRARTSLSNSYFNLELRVTVRSKGPSLHNSILVAVS